MTKIRAFFLKLGHFFPIFEKGQGRTPPLPPSSYAPDTDSVIFFKKETFSPEFCKINHLKTFIKGTEDKEERAR